MVAPTPKERCVVLDQTATIIQRGPEQSIIKWDEGREAVVPNSWIKEEKDK